MSTLPPTLKYVGEPVALEPDRESLPARYNSDYVMVSLPWWCDFGAPGEVEMCGITQAESDNVDMYINHGGTWTLGTGPPSDGFLHHGKCIILFILLS